MVGGLTGGEQAPRRTHPHSLPCSKPAFFARIFLVRNFLTWIAREAGCLAPQRRVRQRPEVVVLVHAQHGAEAPPGVVGDEDV